MNVRPIILLTATLVPALSACGIPIRSGAYAPPSAGIGRGVTFAWNQEADHTSGDPRLQDNKFFEDRLHEAIEWELSLRGVRYDESSPDLLVHHHLSLADHEMAVEAIDEAGYTTTEVYTYEEGTVVVHLLNAESRKDTWLGWAQANVEPALGGPENMRTWVYDLVRRMFESWPVPPRGGQG